MNLRLAILIPIVLGLTACATAIPLDPAAQNVQIIDYLRPEMRSKYVEVDQVTCKLGENGRSWDGNIEGCQNQLRNQAVTRGGEIVLVTSSDIKRYEMGTGMKMMAGNRCENCVEMKGIVYKTKK